MNQFLNTKKFGFIPGFLILTITIIITIYTCVGCEEFLEVDEVKDQLISTQVFNDESSADAAITGIYASVKASAILLSNNLYSSLYVEDLTYYRSSQSILDYSTNKIQPNSSLIPWSEFYRIIFQANEAIEGLSNSRTIDTATIKELMGEARFLRAYSYFFLVNYFGKVPLVKSSNISETITPYRSEIGEIYSFIEEDLLYASDVLNVDYSKNNGEKIRATKYAALALLARVYLYQEKWEKAKSIASIIINSGQYSLLEETEHIFIKNNDESILQWGRYSGEPFTLPTYFLWTSPNFSCSDALINSFNPTDLRVTHWLATINYNEQDYRVPFKFNSIDNTDPKKVYTPLRLGEQYLIRSEARVMSGDIVGAVSDLNEIRIKHGGLAPIQSENTPSELINLILNERKKELFTEESHRFFDLKRRGIINEVMISLRPDSWSEDAQLWPIPLSELQRNPNLDQNKGY